MPRLCLLMSRRCIILWINTEISVLGYRAYTEKDDFRLIVIPYGGVTEAEIARKTAWQPVAVGELQMLPRQGLDETDTAAVEAVIQQVVETLKNLPDVGQDESVSGWLVARLCAFLRLEVADLRKIGSSLGADTAGIADVSVIRRRVAHALYRVGPLGICDLVRYPNCRIETSDLNEVLDILSTYWVDMTASVGILSCCLPTTRCQAVAINGKEVGYTPEAYIRQVCGEQNIWPVVTVEPGLGADAVIAQIRDTLVEKFPIGLRKLLPQLARASSEDITRALNSLIGSEHSVPVFVTFLQVGGGNIDDLISTISGTFPGIRIIVCTGTERGNAVLRPDIHLLTPELSLDEEKRMFDEYCSVSTRLYNR
jgi:hypothetical protein